METKLPISLVIISLNEEMNIGRCIDSVPFASEVIVVDSQSKDRTVSICESKGAKVITKAFAGYREQKQFAHDQATQQWVLSLDADEALSPELQKEIIKLFEGDQKTNAVAYRIPRCSLHLNRWIKHGGWYPDYQTRLYLKQKAKWVGGAVHEHVDIDGPVKSLKSDILHYVFKDLDDQIDTNNEFSTLGAIELHKQGKNFSLLRLIFKPLGKFLECYVWKLGFLDGAPGFIIALGAAQSLFLKYAKLWELTLTSKNP